MAKCCHGVVGHEVALPSWTAAQAEDWLGRCTAAGMLEAVKGFRRLKAYKHLPALRAALAAHQIKHTTGNKLGCAPALAGALSAAAIARTGQSLRVLAQHLLHRADASHQTEALERAVHIFPGQQPSAKRER
jgi:hypothetical protein